MRAAYWQTRLDSIEKNCTVEGWDSYGAWPVTDDALDVVRALLGSADVVPTVNGGIHITLGTEDCIDIEFGPDGRVCGFLFENEEIIRYRGALSSRASSAAPDDAESVTLGPPGNAGDSDLSRATGTTS